MAAAALPEHVLPTICSKVGVSSRDETLNRLNDFADSIHRYQQRWENRWVDRNPNWHKTGYRDILLTHFCSIISNFKINPPAGFKYNAKQFTFDLDLSRFIKSIILKAYNLLDIESDRLLSWDIASLYRCITNPTEIKDFEIIKMVDFDVKREIKTAAAAAPAAGGVGGGAPAPAAHAAHAARAAGANNRNWLVGIHGGPVLPPNIPAVLPAPLPAAAEDSEAQLQQLMASLEGMPNNYGANLGGGRRRSRRRSSRRKTTRKSYRRHH